MKRSPFVLVLAAVLQTAAGPGASPAQDQTVPAQQPQQDRPASALRRFDRFEGTIALRTHDGGVRHLYVVVRNWIVPNGQKVEPFPENGFLLIQLRGGAVTALVDRERARPLEDSFWTIRRGQKLTIETDRDSAVLQTVAVTEVTRGAP